MTRAPSRVAWKGNHRIPVEMSALGDGRLAVGYVSGDSQAHGLIIDPSTGSAESTYQPEVSDDALSRVVPVASNGEPRFETALAESEGMVRSTVVNGSTPYVLGFGDAALTKRIGEGAPVEVWPLEEGAEGDALRALRIADDRIAVTYRETAADKMRIVYGTLDGSGGVVTKATTVAGSGGIVGLPSVGSNGREVSVVFADKPRAPADASPTAYEIRWAHGPVGEPLKDADPLPLPEGGPGGDAGAPSIAGLPDGRWLLLWTEGKKKGEYVLRAQTYDQRYRPVGEALRVSPETGSFGQGQVAIAGSTAVVVFFLAGGTTYQVWGTVLQCR
jgi:hypothetical protein